MSTMYYDHDADLGILAGKTIAVFGYGSQGHAQANNMRDSGIKVIIGLLESDTVSRNRAEEDGFEVYTFEDAAAKADIVHFLVPDENHKEVYERIKKDILPGKIIACSHGFNFHFKRIVPPQGVDVVMIAPKAPGPTVRREYLNGYGVPALVAVYQDASGKALEIALAMAKANGHTRIGVFGTTFKDETETDLFGEQTVLCGGLIYLCKDAFDLLVEAGYPPEMAYFECFHEVKLIVDLMYKGGVYGMMSKVSNTAKYGGYTRGRKVINEESRKVMQEALQKIQNGEFAQEWIAEYEQKKLGTLKSLHTSWKNEKIEQVGKKIREIAGLEELKTGEEEKKK